MTGYRYWRSVDRPRVEQARICYTCLNYAREGKAVRAKIDRLCLYVGGEYAAALREYLTTPASSPTIAIKYHMSERTLQRRAAEVFRAW